MTQSNSPTRNRNGSKAGSASSSTKDRKDICETVTASIITALETGVKPWAQSWKNGPGARMPLRHNGERYRSINILILWAQAMACGYTSPYWMTYRQAQELNAQVRKGEKGTGVVYYGTAPKRDQAPDDNADTSFYRFMKSYTVFNADQIDGLPERYRVKVEAPAPAADRLPELEAFVQATGVSIRHGGNQAFYRVDVDYVQMPQFEQFHNAEFYYSTLMHELAHATRHPSRLDRDLGRKQWGDEGYAKEELVAELASAFLGAEFGFAPEHIDDHASYLASWLKVLQDDKRMIFAMAAKAQAAVDFLMKQEAAEETDARMAEAA